MEKVCFITLGCRVNKYESDCMADILNSAGYFICNQLEYADYYILNTCAVTNEAEKKSRQFIAKFNKLNPNCKIIVCGCACQNDLKQFEGKPNVIAGLGISNRKDILDFFVNPKFDYEHKISNNYENLENPLISTTRGYVKIQDGCNRFCSYCIIPYLRGRSRSRNLIDIVNEVEKLSKKVKYITLVGVDISDYRINNKLALTDLIKSLKNIECKIALGSFEVEVIDNELLEAMKQLINFVPHFHLSLQSGDNDVLKSMNRHYTREFYIEKCELIRDYFPDANITTDIIVGYPTETETNFENTLDMIRLIKFGHVHAFPYSKRKGTFADKLPILDKSIVENRMKRILEVDNITSNDFQRKFLGKESEILVEEKIGEYYFGYSENYIETYIKGNSKNKILCGDFVRVKFIKKYLDGLEGEII